MADKKETTVQTRIIGQMIEAKMIDAAPVPETTSAVQNVRTVTTSLTTGNVSIRYVPRSGQTIGNLNTTS